MEKQFVATNETPKIVLEVNANLRLKGSDELQVVAKTDSENDLTLEQHDDAIFVRCANDCRVTVPRQAAITVQVVRGDATIKGLEGELNVHEVFGNLDLHGSGPATLARVHGNLSVKNVSGDFKVDTVDGNASARDVQGDFLVKEIVRGNLHLNDVSGSASAKVDGNATLSLDPAPGEDFQFSAGGNIFCQVPTDASLKVQVTHAGNIAVNLPGAIQPASGEQTYTQTFGDGDATLTLSASGNVVLGGKVADWDVIGDLGVDLGEEFGGMAETIGEQITQQIETQMEMLESQLEAQLSNLTLKLGAIGLSAEDQERIAQRARQDSERTAERIQEKMRRVQEKLDRKMAETQRRAEQKARAAQHRAAAAQRRAHSLGRHSWNFSWPTPPVPPEAPGESVSDEERVMILRMLEQKKITPEQADQLLTALEGKGS